MATPDVALRFQAASLVYPNGTRAIDALDVDVPRGRVLALVGPSGCGKSSALRLAAGLEAPSSGRVVIDPGPDPGPQPLAFVFQDPTLLPWRRAVGNVALPLELRGDGRDERDRAVADVLARVGLSGFGDAYPRELSGGMRMRASLARALVTRPRILLLDEPFGALDEITRQRLQSELLDLQAFLALTVVFVTHSAFEAVFLADEVAVMTPRPGRIAGTIGVDLPRPRPATVRADPTYARLVGRVSDLLREHAS